MIDRVQQVEDHELRGDLVLFRRGLGPRSGCPGVVQTEIFGQSAAGAAGGKKRGRRDFSGVFSGFIAIFNDKSCSILSCNRRPDMLWQSHTCKKVRGGAASWGAAQVAIQFRQTVTTIDAEHQLATLPRHLCCRGIYTTDAYNLHNHQVGDCVVRLGAANRLGWIVAAPRARVQ